MKNERVVIKEKVTNWLAIIFTTIANFTVIFLYFTFIMFGYDMFTSSSAGEILGKTIFFFLQHMFLALLILVILIINEDWRSIRWKEKRREVEIERGDIK